MEPAPPRHRPEGPKRKGPKHAAPRGRRARERRAALAQHAGQDRRVSEERRTSEEERADRERRSGVDRRTRAERRTGAERRSGIDRRGGTAAPSAATGRTRTDLRALAAKVRTYLSAIALSALAAVGSYTGTYRVMEFLFAPAVVTPVAAPVAAPVTPTDGAAHQGSPPEAPSVPPPAR